MTQYKMSPETEPGKDARARGDAVAARGMSRRRFSQAALGSVPVLMTLYSNPLKASNGVPANCHPSGWVSGNTSLHGGAGDCGGESPGHVGNSGNGGVATQARLRDFNEDFDFRVDPPEFRDNDDLSLNLNYAASSTNNPVYRNGTAVVDFHRKLIRFGAAAYMSSREVYGYRGPGEGVIAAMVSSALNNEDYANSNVILTPSEVLAFLKNLESGQEGFPLNP
ncbi:hypothetical protein [Ectothiorhodospira variabilis]|uniref:hypothetical protein n=1 Tax=Ectothiorhodospira variabilis TaxID=505694 RepID=UPI001EFA9079|nr:hypothetical protein [Ectothiorhodospira variabilis]MCG5495344.1 hypothetical protein [Ectothiorhodospira variabilis]MCG5504942.1 hypothetical protein [Ectothiorhodospira variabilis]MCG5508099.1 hypothetical protein [Ectothiorhodospira variabilis]